MTAVTGRAFGPQPFSGDDAIAFGLDYPLAANVGPFRNWLLGLDSSGNAKAVAADVTNLISAGFADRDQASSATAALAVMMCRQQFVSGYPSSTGASDAITAADVAVACWGADNQTVAKKSNLSGHNRSMLGLTLGLDNDGTVIFYPGPIGWTLARAAHIADSYAGAHFAIADAAANTATAERAIPREKVHGKVTAIEFIGAAIVADNTDYITVTVAKRDGAGGAGTTLGTYDSRAANQGAVTAFTPATFALSSTATDLDLLETDIVTLTVVKGGAGKVITGAIRVIQKVG